MISSTEGVSDFGEAVLRELLCNSHRHLSRSRDRSIAPLRHEVCHLNLVVLGDLALNVIKRHLLILQREQIFEAVLDQLYIKRPAGKIGAGNDPLQRALQIANIRADTLSNEKGRIRRK